MASEGCPACQSVLLEMTGLMTEDLEAHWKLCEFSTDPLTNTPSSGRTKRRRADEDVKAALLDRTKKSRISAGGLGKLIGTLSASFHNWAKRKIPSIMLAGWQAFGGAGELICSVCFDAIRVGKPKEETVLYAGTNGTYSSWMAPMVLAL